MTENVGRVAFGCTPVGNAQAQASVASIGPTLAALNLNRVWLILRDHGYDGVGEPFAAYRDKVSADRAMTLLAKADGTFKCVEVEVW